MATAQLSIELAQQIVARVNQLLSKNISLCNTDGLVVASSYPDKVGTTEAGAANLTADQPKVLSSTGRQAVATPLLFHGSPAATLVIYDDSAWQDHVPLVKSLAELLAERYLQLQEPAADSKDRIIYRLLKTEDPANFENLAAEAVLAGFDLARPRIAMIIRLNNFWQSLFKEEVESDSREANIVRFRHKIEQAFAGFFTSSADNIVAYIGDDLFVVLKDISTTSEDKVGELLKKNFDNLFAQVKNSIIKDVAVGVGGYHPDLPGLRQSAREAMLALELGERMWGANRAYHINNLGVPGLIAEATSEKKLDFADRLLGPLLPHKELVRTMEEFFNHNLNLTNAAEALEIHRNTLIYRLDKISSIINLDPRIFQEAVQIYLALMIKRVLS